MSYLKSANKQKGSIQSKQSQEKCPSNFHLIYEKAYKQLSKYSTQQKPKLSIKLKTITNSSLQQAQKEYYFPQKNKDQLSSRKEYICSVSIESKQKHRRQSIVNISKTRMSKKSISDMNIGKIRLGSMVNRKIQILNPAQRVAQREASKQMQRKNRQSLTTLPVISQISSARVPLQEHQKLKPRFSHYKSISSANLSKKCNKLLLRNPQLGAWEGSKDDQQNGIFDINLLK